VIKQVYHVIKEGRLNKTSNLTLDVEKPNVEKSSASSTDHGGHHDLKVAGSQGTSLTGDPTGLTSHAKKFVKPRVSY
jgi:hypothetical protein